MSHHLSKPVPAGESATHDADAWIAHADACFNARRHQEAIHAFERALALRPDDIHALHLLGLACYWINQRERACESLERALTVAPARAEIWEHRGLLAALCDDPVGAEAFYRRALQLAPRVASAHRNLADSLKSAGRLEEAAAHYQEALALEPSLHHAVRALARISTERGAHDAAADYWLHAWALDPTHLADALSLIAALSAARRDELPGALLPSLRERFSTDATALQHLAFALNGAGRFANAAEVALQGIAVDPRNGWLHHNASYAFNMHGDFETMYRHAAEAARLEPDNPLMQFNLAAAQLRAGDFERGWRQYAWHEALPENHDLARPDFPEWKGERVTGRRFLLIGEQGLGDQLQFLCMADWLHRRGARVDVWVLPPLGEVARNASGVRTAWTTLPPGPYDYWCRMTRMPEHMCLTLPMLPLATHYLAADPSRAERWRNRIGKLASAERVGEGEGASRKRVGIVWAGNPAYGLDRYRSTALGQWQTLLHTHDVCWFALQKGEAEEQTAALPGVQLHSLGPEIHDFADTLAIIQSLDLVITVDTAVAHLAGACGTPTWVLVPIFTDWRWMTGRNDSPWYPSMRLFRQRELGEWDAVLAGVALALQEWAPR